MIKFNLLYHFTKFSLKVGVIQAEEHPMHIMTFSTKPVYLVLLIIAIQEIKMIFGFLHFICALLPRFIAVRSLPFPPYFPYISLCRCLACQSTLLQTSSTP